MKWIEGEDYFAVSDGYNVIGKHTINSGITGVRDHQERYYITPDGTITLKDGFWWNGSNMSLDLDTNIRASAFHDLGYWLLEMGVIENTWGNRRKVDKMMYNIMREDGASWIRCRYFWRALRTFGWLSV